MTEHTNFNKTAGGGWEVAIPIHPSGLLGWKVRRACRKAGGHSFHADRQWGWACCRCGHRDENPKLLRGHLCSDNRPEPEANPEYPCTTFRDHGACAGSVGSIGCNCARPTTGEPEK